MTQLETYEIVARDYWRHGLIVLVLGGLATGLGPVVMLAAEVTLAWAMFRAAAWVIGS